MAEVPLSVAEREARTLAAIDAANDDDPDRVVVAGEERPLQQTLGRIASEWVDRLDPDATPAQRLAARAHHLRRWELPRDSFPEGRSGYLRWRTAAKTRHANDVVLLLQEQGWDAATVEEARRLVRKEGLGRDPDVQVHEDAVCLAFLTVQLDEAAELMGDKTVGVLRRTAAKMSDQGLAHAAELPLSDEGRALLEAALEPEPEA
ncbi:DUF4202 domain-containing protein [Iamia majanohamensis]|uniref:DUF4202 domain-containing protein n=1 Tax=Iamia majanohamensis TaxID=467976 RepID=A0AAE9Y3F8_9ACTN|nr:DUF4202 domain-containing protein [Iamia majanohamensis]WCO65765.1 DUF4202 domain-containing protein [Iamia majanohamensis]